MLTRAMIISLCLATAPVAALALGDDAPAKAQNEPSTQEAEPADQAAQKAKEKTQENQPAPKSDAHIARAVFTTEVKDHEPVDELGAVPAGLDRVYYFTEIKDLEGTLIRHRWLLDGETVAEIPIQVEGPRWRAFSVKEIQPGETGTLTVQVIGADGTILNQAELPAAAKAKQHGQS